MPPYANASDVKPPLLFALMAGAEALFGPCLLAAKALAMAPVGDSVRFVPVRGRRFMGELSGVAAALFYIVASLVLSGAVSPAELIMAPFTAFGMLAGFAAIVQGRPRLWVLAGAGALLGAAACVKQTAIFEALSLVAAWFCRVPRETVFRRLPRSLPGPSLSRRGLHCFSLPRVISTRCLTTSWCPPWAG